MIFFTKTEKAHFGDKIQSIDFPNIEVGMPKNYLNKGESQANKKNLPLQALSYW